MLNTFFALDPERATELTSADILDYWEQSGVCLTSEPASRPTQAIRAMDALDATRARIDGQWFVQRGKRGSGYPGHYRIHPDIAIHDSRIQY